MPCDTITTYSASLETVSNWDRLEKVSRELGWKVLSRSETHLILAKDGIRIDLVRGQERKGARMTVSGRYLTRDELARIQSEFLRGYGKSTVRDAAKKFGWMVREDQKQGDRLYVTRGSG